VQASKLTPNGIAYAIDACVAAVILIRRDAMVEVGVIRGLENLALKRRRGLLGFF